MLTRQQRKRIDELLAVPEEIKGNYLPRITWQWIAHLQDVVGPLGYKRSGRLRELHRQLFGRQL